MHSLQLQSFPNVGAYLTSLSSAAAASVQSAATALTARVTAAEATIESCLNGRLATRAWSARATWAARQFSAGCVRIITPSSHTLMHTVPSRSNSSRSAPAAAGIRDFRRPIAAAAARACATDHDHDHCKNTNRWPGVRVRRSGQSLLIIIFICKMARSMDPGDVQIDGVVYGCVGDWHCETLRAPHAQSLLCLRASLRSASHPSLARSSSTTFLILASDSAARLGLFFATAGMDAQAAPVKGGEMRTESLTTKEEKSGDHTQR